MKFEFHFHALRKEFCVFVLSVCSLKNHPFCCLLGKKKNVCTQICVCAACVCARMCVRVCIHIYLKKKAQRQNSKAPLGWGVSLHQLPHRPHLKLQNAHCAPRLGRGLQPLGRSGARSGRRSSCFCPGRAGHSSGAVPRRPSFLNPKLMPFRAI